MNLSVNCSLKKITKSKLKFSIALIIFCLIFLYGWFFKEDEFKIQEETAFVYSYNVSDRYSIDVPQRFVLFQLNRNGELIETTYHNEIPVTEPFIKDSKVTNNYEILTPNKVFFSGGSELENEQVKKDLFGIEGFRGGCYVEKNNTNIYIPNESFQNEKGKWVNSLTIYNENKVYSIPFEEVKVVSVAADQNSGDVYVLGTKYIEDEGSYFYKLTYNEEIDAYEISDKKESKDKAIYEIVVNGHGTYKASKNKIYTVTTNSNSKEDGIGETALNQTPLSLVILDYQTLEYEMIPWDVETYVDPIFIKGKDNLLVYYMEGDNYQDYIYVLDYETNSYKKIVVPLLKENISTLKNSDIEFFYVNNKYYINHHLENQEVDLYELDIETGKTTLILNHKREKAWRIIGSLITSPIIPIE